MMENTTPKYIKTFACKKCDFICCKMGDYNRHLNSKKHNTTKIQQKILHSCECGKSYNHRASLFNHKKKCNYVFVEENENKKITTISENIDYKDLLMKAMNQMQEQQEELRRKDEIMVRMIDRIETTNNTINNTNNNNFNITPSEKKADTKHNYYLYIL
jgi:hypothetical protein